MSLFEPLINLIVLLSVLSLATERVTNAFKLGRERMRTQSEDSSKEKERERDIAWTGMGVAAVVAILAKADLFEILRRLDAPWETLGWAQFTGTGLIRTASITGPLSVIYAIGGCLLTAFALGFGSKFWHDMLDIVFNARERLKKAAGGGK